MNCGKERLQPADPVSQLPVGATLDERVDTLRIIHEREYDPTDVLAPIGIARLVRAVGKGDFYVDDLRRPAHLTRRYSIENDYSCEYAAKQIGCDDRKPVPSALP